jgi:hypothetical protein
MFNYLVITILSISLSSIYYYFNRGKNEAVFIWFLTFIIFLIVNTLLKVEISFGMWIWLFAVLSLLSFRKTFSITTLKYFLIAISLWIINAFFSHESYIISVFILIVLIIIERFFLKNKNIKIELKMKLEDFNNNLSEKNINNIVQQQYWVFLIKQVIITQENVLIKWIQ